MGKSAKLATKAPEAKRENAISQTRKPERSQSRSSSVDRLLFLQRTVGNQAVQRMMKSNALQAKLRIGQPNDKYEQEADRVAAQVMRMTEPCMQRQPAIQPKPPTGQISPIVQRQPDEEEEPGEKSAEEEPEEKKEEPLMTKQASGQTPQVGPGLAVRIQSLKGGGQPLPRSERAFFEPRFGADFGNVRVHSDARAAYIAQSVNARAFTLGRDVVFGVGQYSPGTSPGRKLLAHELTHVMQQHGGGGARLKKTPSHFPPFIQRKAGDVLKVNHFNLTMFLSSYETGSLVPPIAIKAYLTNPPLLKMAKELKNTILYNHKQGLTPISLNMLQWLAAGRTTHVGTILLLCHNVTKGFARGSKALNITKHSKRDYYKLFDKKAFGDTDPGDWYHYFAMTLPAYYFTKGKVETKRPTLPKESAKMGIKRDFVMSFLKLIAGKMKDNRIPSSRAYTSWLNANALSFLEGVYWGHNQKEVNGESRVHLKGAKKGIALAGQKAGRTWKWYVPICKGFIIPGKSEIDSILDSHVRLNKQGIMPYTYEIWDINGKLVKRGNTKVPNVPPVKSPSPAPASPPSPPAKPKRRR